MVDLLTRAGEKVNHSTGPGDVLSIALHISLLEVGRKPVQVLIVGQQGMRLSTKEVAIPDAKDGKDHRKIGFHGGSAEVVIHPVGT